MFDPYRKWLAIPPKDQPPHFYRLLGVEVFESDAEVIECAADKQMNCVRQYQSGEHAAAAARILNELAAARLCLLKPATKAAYDENLKASLEAQSPGFSEMSFAEDGKALPVAAIAHRKNRSAKSVSIRQIVGIGSGIIALVIIAIIVINGRAKTDRSEKAAISDRSSSSSSSTLASGERSSSGSTPQGVVATANDSSRPTASQELPAANSNLSSSSEVPLPESATFTPNERTDSKDLTDNTPPDAPTAVTTNSGIQPLKSDDSSDWQNLLPWAIDLDWKPQGINWNDHVQQPVTQEGIRTRKIPFARFPLPAIVDGNYDLDLEFVRTSGNEEIAIYFPVGVHTMRLLIGTQSNTAAEVSFVDRKSLERPLPSPIATGERHRVRIQALQDGDKAKFRIGWDDVGEFMSWEGRSKSLADFDFSNWGTTMIRRPWIGSQNSEVLFQRLQIKMLSGTIHRDPPTSADLGHDLEHGYVRLVYTKLTNGSVGAWEWTVNQIPSAKQGYGTEERWPMIVPDFHLCKEFYGAHAPSRLRSPIPSNARSFSVVGYNEASRSTKFILEVDGQRMYESFRGGLDVIKLDLPRGSKQLELIADQEDENAYDHVYWCDPRYHSESAEKLSDKDLDGKSSFVKFKVTSNTTHGKMTHNEPIPGNQSRPLSFRDYRPCDEFVLAHAPSSLTFEVPKGMTRFSAIGMNVISHEVKFEVWAQGKLLYQSSLAGIDPIDVKLPQGTKSIELKVDSVGGGAGDQSIWCYPRLYRK